MMLEIAEKEADELNHTKKGERSNQSDVPPDPTEEIIADDDYDNFVSKS